MTEFTKGPWESIVGSTCGRDVISPNSPKTKRRVAACGGPNRDANAHLIAAAPDLYEALQEAAILIDRIIKGEDWGAIEEYYVEAMDALAKARGEA